MLSVSVCSAVRRWSSIASGAGGIAAFLPALSCLQTWRQYMYYYDTKHMLSFYRAIIIFG